MKGLDLLNEFLGRAAGETYAGSGPEADPETRGFKELEFKDGDWYYRDSYCGFFRSWGREVVSYKGKPAWCQNYGGGMEIGFQTNVAFAHRTFNFLKKALGTGEKQKRFQPRGPKSFKDRNWQYTCEWHGHISAFYGHESISYKGVQVFSHDFHGGIIKGK